MQLSIYKNQLKKPRRENIGASSLLNLSIKFKKVENLFKQNDRANVQELYHPRTTKTT